jgi:hypothetical protein
LLVAAVLLALLLFVIILTITAPARALAESKARWAAQGYSDYRIVVKYALPLYDCVQDFEVRGGEIAYRHKDECSLTPVAGNNNGLFEPLIVPALFQRIDETLNTPVCGPNGCLCDGPLGVEVSYNGPLGYPQQITYRLMPDARWRYPDYWLVRFTGSLNCPTTGKNTLGGYAGPVITVTSLTSLKPEQPDGGGLGGLSLATATPGS